MKQYAVIGASSFGKRVLDELILIDCEIILIDKDPDLIDYYKNDVTVSYVANVLNETTLKKLIPQDIDAVVVDLGDKIETSILVTQYLKKIGIPQIIVKAETEEHGEILEIIGAHQVVFPNLEAAKRVTPQLVSDLLFNYLPISGGLVLAETGVMEEFSGKSLMELNFRKDYGINVVAFRRSGQGDYQFVTPEYRLSSSDVLLVVGREEDVSVFTKKENISNSKKIGQLFRLWFNRKAT